MLSPSLCAAGVMLRALGNVDCRNESCDEAADGAVSMCDCVASIDMCLLLKGITPPPPRLEASVIPPGAQHNEGELQLDLDSTDRIL